MYFPSGLGIGLWPWSAERSVSVDVCDWVRYGSSRVLKISVEAITIWFLVITASPPLPTILLRPPPKTAGDGSPRIDPPACKRSLPAESPRSCRRSGSRAHKGQKSVGCRVADIARRARVRETKDQP